MADFVVVIAADDDDVDDANINDNDDDDDKDDDGNIEMMVEIMPSLFSSSLSLKLLVVSIRIISFFVLLGLRTKKVPTSFCKI